MNTIMNQFCKSVLRFAEGVLKGSDFFLWAGGFLFGITVPLICVIAVLTWTGVIK